MTKNNNLIRLLQNLRTGRTAVKALTLLMFAACLLTANAKDVTDSIDGDEHLVCSDVMYASTNAEHYKNVHGAEYMEVAQQSFIYAFMSSNAYGDFKNKKPEFAIPGWERVGDKRTTRKGMGAHVYLSTTGPQTVAIVFEGTKQIRDWFFGNLNLFWKGQYGDAERLTKEISEQYPDAKLVTAGHSLGGGLAIHAALYSGGADAYAFNTSPRIFNSKKYDPTNTTITLLSENKDVLAKARKKWKSLEKLNMRSIYNEFDFLDLETNDGDRVGEHSIYIIARGLVIVAAAAGDARAKRWMTNNLSETNAKTCIDA